ncbi:hypothetical protein G6O69_12100 [Pseudenhygromyxa sp. WMMC2535]|uniref:hypothetical protein n=1 Tax=Pseudenhygromyxa sp. WMMC2535 TaxID=2712867 RepID=UPI00155475F2|nr:hypothetical protein [Pseudenhygromyxa sp. WMMC2535]NVB38575.1 hypothetical protein [Pseudenhygromyxa sp. WMMC2535]
MPEVCNVMVSNNKLLEGAIRQLESRLPPGWAIESLMGRGPVDAELRFTSSEGRSRSVPVEIKRRIDPRMASQLPLGPLWIVVAPYLSKSVREVLEERGASYADQTGNTRVVLDEPGLFILTTGADSNPWPDKRKLSLRGIKAGRVVRALAVKRPPVGVRELAELADTDPGYVSRLLRMLDSEAIVERTARGRVELVDWRRLLVQWSEDVPLEGRAETTTWLAPRGLKSVLDRLGSMEFPYLLTGSAAASRVAPVAPTRLLSVYVDDPSRAAEALGLRPADAGANVILLQPEDEAIYQRAIEVEGLRQASLPMIAADLLTGPGRSPAEAEALMDWMENNEEVWRG